MVSPLGLGTVKFGRNQKIKYPFFELPSDREIESLLDLALELGINLLDTAPAYGIAEERLGKLVGARPFVIVSKTGEEFEQGQSRYDFSASHTRLSVERSLRRLRRATLDAVLLHCDANDLEQVQSSDAPAVLQALKEKGDIRAIGASTNTLQGGLAALSWADLVMVTFNPSHRSEQPVIEQAARLGKGILVKKAFGSGQLVGSAQPSALADCLQAAFALPGVTSVVAGTINPEHLRTNAHAVAAAIPPARS